MWSWLPLLGSATAFGAAPLEWLQTQALKLGPVFVAMVAGKRMVFVTDQKAWPKIFKDKKSLDFEAIANQVVVDAFGLNQREVKLVFHEDLQKQYHAQYIRCLMGRESVDSLTTAASKAIHKRLDTLNLETKTLRFSVF